MAPARRRALAKNGAATTGYEAAEASESATEISLPRRAAASRGAQKKQASSRGRGKAADPEPESEPESVAQDNDEAVAEEAEEEQDDEPRAEASASGRRDRPLVRLRFSEPLSWRPGKPIPTEELLRRLKSLNRELSDLDQETLDTESLAKVAQELANHNLLNHKDKGIKAFAAACLVDILCLCAPNAPFTQTQLKVRVSHTEYTRQEPQKC